MSPALARLQGTPAEAIKKIDLHPDHPWQPLATFLAGEDAQFLEQERVDPVPV